MSRRKFFYYWLLHSLAAFLVILVQVTVGPHITVLGLHPMSVLFMPAIVATYNPLRHSLLYSAILGIVCDLLAPGPIPIFYLLTYTLIAAAAHLISRRMQPTLPCSLTVCLSAWSITGLVRLFLLSMAPGFAFGAAASILGRELLISIPAMALVHGLCILLRRHLAQV